jgi:hypothetical protein
MSSSEVVGSGAPTKGFLIAPPSGECACRFVHKGLAEERVTRRATPWRRAMENFMVLFEREE